MLIKSNEDDREWVEIDEEGRVFHELLQISKSKLSMSAKRSPMMMEPLISKIGIHSETEFARGIIEGQLQEFPELESLSKEDTMILQSLIQSFRRPRVRGQVLQDLEWSYGIEQYRETFSKARENTAVGPSGLIMPLWRAACYDEELSEINAMFIEIPFKYGFPLERWREVTHTMIPKADRPYINKIRNIQLTEADYNGAHKFIIGKKLRKYCESNGTSSENTFGGRSRKNCIQMLKTIQTINEVNRLNYTFSAKTRISAND